MIIIKETSKSWCKSIFFVILCVGYIASFYAYIFFLINIQFNTINNFLYITIFILYTIAICSTLCCFINFTPTNPQTNV